MMADPTLVGTNQMQQCQDQFNCQLNIRLMALHSKGQNHEKLKQFEFAI